MFNLFDNKIRESIGVDIGDYSIKMVAISNNQNRLVLNNYAEVLLSAYAAKSKGEIVKLGDQQLKQAFEDCYMALKSEAKNIVISLQMSKCKIIYFKVPVSVREILDNIVGIETKKYYNISLSDFTLTYNIIEEDADYLGISVLAVNNTEVNRLKYLLSGYQNINYRFEPSLFGLLRNIDVVSSTGFDIAIDLGASLTSIAYIVNGKIYGTDIIGQGTNVAIVKIKESLLISREEANDIYYKLSILDDKNFSSEIVNRTFVHIVEEVMHMINNFGIKYNLKCSNIYISGGGAKVIDVESFFKNEFAPYQVNMIRSFDRLYITEVLRNELNKSSPSFNNSVGLALANII